MKRRQLCFLLLVVVGFMLGGCGWLWPPVAPTLVAIPDAGHPLDKDHGLFVAFSFSEEASSVRFNAGDASEVEVCSNVPGQFLTTHVYNFTGTEIPSPSGTVSRVYRATASANGRTAFADVTLINQAPTVYPAFSATGCPATGFEWKQVVYYDARLRYHGCNGGTGSAESVTGAFDPDGDLLEWFRWTITGPTKTGDGRLYYAVFDVHGLNITGQQVNTSDYDDEDAALAILIVGVGADTLAGAQALRSPQDTGYPVIWHTLAADDLLQTQSATIPPEAALLAIVPVYMTVTLEVADSWGGVGSLTWDQPIIRSGCSE